MMLPRMIAGAWIDFSFSNATIVQEVSKTHLTRLGWTCIMSALHLIHERVYPWTPPYMAIIAVYPRD